METLASRLTSKCQATIPGKVRQRLGIQKGDLIGFEIRKNQIILKKISPADVAFARALTKTLSEWESENDEEAYADL